MRAHALRGLGWVGTMAVAAAFAVAPAQARTYEYTDATAAATTHLRHEANWWRGRTWYWEDAAGRRRTATSHAERTAVGPYLVWVKHLWVQRAAAAKRAAHSRHVVLYSGDWYTAVQLVQRVWPGSSGWLMSCSSGEGGHGGFVWRGHVTPRDTWNTPGGNLQYMQSTWVGNYVSAVADARARGYRLPAAGYYTPMGQAIAGAWAWSRGHTGQWTGAGC